MPKFFHTVSDAQPTGNKPCNVRMGAAMTFPETIRGKIVIGRADWYGYQGIVLNEAGDEVWRGPMREAPSQPGTVTIAGAVHNGDAVPPAGRSDAEARALAASDARAAASRMGEAVLAAAFKAEKKPIVARYKGEWMLQDHAFVLQGPDGKQYAWVVSREIPAMSYGVQDGDDDDTVPGPATWLSDGQLNVDIPKTTTKAIMENGGHDAWPMPTLMAPGFSHPLPPGNSGALSASTVRPSRVIDAQFKDLGATPIKPSLGERLANRAGRALGQFFGGGTSQVVAVVAVVGAYHVGRWAAHKYMAHRSAKKAAAIASKASTLAPSGGGGSAAAAKPKKPPMPGWPAINFRGGKKAKAAKKAASAETYSLTIETEKNHKASFDMKDGSVDELKCMAITAVVRDTDGDLVWSTSQLHIPVERQNELLIPVNVQAVAYAATLLNEAEAYIEFIESEPDMEVFVESDSEPKPKQKAFSMVEACPHCGGKCVDGMCPDCSSEPAMIGPPDMAQASATSRGRSSGVPSIPAMNVSQNRWSKLV